MSAITVGEHPAHLYLDGIAVGSRWSMRLSNPPPAT